MLTWWNGSARLIVEIEKRVENPMAQCRDDMRARTKLGLQLAGSSSAGTKKLGLVLQRGDTSQDKPKESLENVQRTISSHNVAGHLTSRRFAVDTRASTWQYKEKPFAIRMAEAPVKDVAPLPAKRATPSPFKKARKGFTVEVKK